VTVYLELADYLLIAEAVLRVPVELIAEFNRIGLADSALAAPQAGFGGVRGLSGLVCLGSAVGFRQARGEDPDELRRRPRPHPGPRVRQVVLHGRVRQAESVGGRLLGSGASLRYRHRTPP
jgi:hypothetical protein